jgi:hypothetical protein
MKHLNLKYALIIVFIFLFLVHLLANDTYHSPLIRIGLVVGGIILVFQVRERYKN